MKNDMEHKDDIAEKGPLAQREEEVLRFWRENNIFEKSLEKPAPKGEYVFYDGPPFASGTPHYGHILASTIKDAIPRYRTMRGYHVARKWGWDCHGLPVENLVEKDLGLKSKRDIEQYGIEQFNETARRSIMKDDSYWKVVIPRLGRWVDMEHSYKTMDASYTESVWWAFKNLYNRGLIYEGFKALHYCPHCGTTLSNFEVAQGYKDINDIAVTVKLPLVDEPETSLLIWTTTPWTLPGNTAAAVNAEARYVKVKIGEEFVIASAEYFSKNSSEGLPTQHASQKSSDLPPPEGQTFAHHVASSELEIVQEFSGKELVGKAYLPPFEYFATEMHKHKQHAWKVYAADYVTLTDGTGIVHIAPAYGEEDYTLAKREKIPLIHHVTDEGKFIATVTDFAGLAVKPKGNPRETDEKVAEHLNGRGLLFKVEQITHSYPHCWRCDTPLLNWTADSWFVKVSELKKKLLGENAKIGWTPSHIGTGRFNNGLAGAPDWAISRSRYWGAPVPVWRHSKTKELKVIGSVEELLSLVHRSGNRYFVMRHGEAQNNIESIVDNGGTGEKHLTKQGRVEAGYGATDLKREKIDLIITSPLPRTRETAAIVQKELNLPDSAVMVDERLREVGVGVFDGKSLSAWKKFFNSFAERFDRAPEGGETYRDARRRLGECLFEIEQRYVGKNILIVSHEGPAWLLNGIVLRWSVADVIAKKTDENFLKTGGVKEISFIPFPHNADYELDLHRPYIDDVVLASSLAGQWKRVNSVFDCWFESGSMPFASNHYPFKKKRFDPKRLFGFDAKGYPADFIAEGLDQTRGWFYSLIVLGTALFGKSPYKNVIVNGLVLASDGQKMSKRLKNYPDPMEVVNKYGADSLRYYLLSSQLLRGEDLRLQEKGIDEVSKKLLMRLDNVRSFYDLYAPASLMHASTKPTDSEYADFPAGKSAEVLAPSRSKPSPSVVLSSRSSHILDRWILSRLAELVQEATAGFEKYELDVATRPLAGFIDDLSTWYLRRSRERFKGDGEDMMQALTTLRSVLHTLAHVMAPTMPFFAEDLYQRVRVEGDAESVHLSIWPEAEEVDENLHKDMSLARELSSKGLELRERAGIKIRQPLASFTAKSLPADPALLAIIADELNVKEVLEYAALVEEARLDINLTPELKEEGMLRDMVRMVQELRKKEGLTIADRPTVAVTPRDEKERAFFEKWKDVIVQETNLATLTISDALADSENVELKIVT